MKPYLEKEEVRNADAIGLTTCSIIRGSYCCVCDRQTASSSWTKLSSSNFVEMDKYYLVCSKQCKELFELSPVLYTEKGERMSSEQKLMLLQWAFLGIGVLAVMGMLFAGSIHNANLEQDAYKTMIASVDKSVEKGMDPIKAYCVYSKPLDNRCIPYFKPGKKQ